MKQLGENIRKMRNRWHMSQRAFADLLNVSRNVVMNWERGRSVPDHTALSHLSRLSGISIGDIGTVGKIPVFHAIRAKRRRSVHAIRPGMMTYPQR